VFEWLFPTVINAKDSACQACVAVSTLVGKTMVVANPSPGGAGKARHSSVV